MFMNRSAFIGSVLGASLSDKLLDTAIQTSDNTPEEKSKTEENDGPSNDVGGDYPDGGLRAWLVIAGTMCSMFSTFGFINAWGVFQAYYEETLLSDSDPSAIAWIGSIQYALVFMPGLVTGRMFDIGHFKVPFLLASILLVVATFLVAECSQYWHFLLCQGFAIGMASGTIFGPSVGVVGHWFRRRRGIAIGLIATGASIGGTVFPIVARGLINTVGFPWTMRIIGFILVAGLGIANLTMKRRLPPVNSPGGILNLRAFKSAPYAIWCLSTFIAFLGLYTALLSYGVSPDVAFYLVAIANASSGIGRIVSGICVDRLGALNYFGPMTIIAGILTYAWPFARSVAAMIAVAVIYGFSSGAYISSFLIPMIELGEISDIGRRTGMAFTIAAFGAVAGPPISGAINTATGDFEAMGYYAGSAIMLAVVLMYFVRYLVVGTLRGRF
ncbi:major facilitator superfamily domain-containing protein [Armillaria novae-zelandiae]|uniref:Major facilitator superfamily domain-containing protein n=1 Tax=Armillaria novae-zelandiae TaxID=153914 RepID=A0AA39PU92_9AGAR|nr:major facilitator superfamily domain-containing protein [Armillaria novae-zelandiae]